MTGNLISQSIATKMAALIDKLNKMGNDELNEMYKDQLKNGEISI